MKPHQNPPDAYIIGNSPTSLIIAEGRLSGFGREHNLDWRMKDWFDSTNQICFM